MATTTTKTIKTSGGDYTSLSAWEAAQQGDLPTLDEIRQAECYTMADTAGIVAISGWVTDATRYIRIFTPAAERHDGTRASGYRFAPDGAWSHALQVQEDFVRFEGIAFTNTTANNSNQANLAAIGNSAGADIRLDECLVYDGQRGIIISGAAAQEVYIRNTIVIGCEDEGILLSDTSGWNGKTWIYNCSIAACGTYGVHSMRGTNVIKNTYAGGCTTADYYDPNTTLTMSDCASSDTTSYGTNPNDSVAYATGSGAYFTNVTSGSEDLHIGASSALKTAGGDLSADGDYGFTIDIDNDTRSDWSIGADEIVAAASGFSLSMGLLGVGT